ncbi:MAG: RNA polymerase sigma factor [Oscillospiraceae bacterium]|nr:RNA polymerase sigma factor [Oscillospiraceae bacterium]
MNHLPVLPEKDLERILRDYGDMLFRLCLVMLGNPADAEDAVQETMIRCYQKAPRFRDPEHEKAWLLKVAANLCRDQLRFRARHPQVDIDSITELAAESPDSGILEALMALPEKFRLVLVMHYVEGYRVEEIAGIIGRTPSAVKMRLQKGRNLLKEHYRKEYM